MTMRVKAGRSAPKPLNSDSNSGITKISRIVVTMIGDDHDRGRVEQRLLDLLLDGLGLLLVGRHLVEQGVEGARVLADLDQVDVQVVEVQRVLGERLGQRRAALQVLLDRQDQLLHGGVVVAGADDLEGLHQRNARLQHGGELAAEDARCRRA